MSRVKIIYVGRCGTTLRQRIVALNALLSRSRGRKARAFGLTFLAICLTNIAHAEDGATLFATCTACHGENAGGNPALGAPALAGQLAPYLTRQLHLFRDGLRGAAEGDSYGAQMRPFATGLADDNAVQAVATYLAALPPVAQAAIAAGDPRRGASLYNGNCGACHGGAAEGNAALNAPRLAGVDGAYLKRQFLGFKSGVRGGDSRDRLGRQMAMMANSLSDDAALDDVLSYIVGLPVAGGSRASAAAAASGR